MRAALPGWIGEALAAHGGCLAAAELARARAETGLDAEGLALALLPEAAARAHAPISGFQVGAVAVCGTREGGVSIALGANFECVGAPLACTVHAEQAAVHLARKHGARRLLALALGAPPCGHCRQFLLEAEGGAELRLLLADGAVHRLDALIPHSFGPADLGRAPALLGSPPHALRLHDDSSDALVRDAFEAARAAYAPYARAPAGVALLGADGRVHQGSSLECAAFNPSLGALSAALSAMALAGAAGAPLALPVRAVMVEAAGLASQRVLAEALLGALAPRLALEWHAAAAG
jgi:cytidine deaminase